MFNVSRADQSIAFDLSAEMPLVDDVRAQCRDFLAEISDGLRNDVVRVVEKLLTHSIGEGNADQPAADLRCEVELAEEGTIKVLVQAQGEGSAARYDANEGVFQDLEPLLDRYEVGDDGTSVVAYMASRAQPAIAVSRIDDRQVFVPRGDLKAESAKELRQLLTHTLEEQSVRCRFDLANVEDIDAMNLSVLIGFLYAARKLSGTSYVEMVNVAPDLTNLFHAMRIDSFFHDLGAQRGGIS